MKKTLFAITLAALSLPLSHSHAEQSGDFAINENSFQDIFNQARTGQPRATPWPGTFWPYSYDGTAAKVKDGDFSNGTGAAPLEAFDSIAGLSGSDSALAWEKENHTCSKISDRKEKASCEGWWGHCNGWTGAAIKEPEPRRDFRVKGVDLTVADAKGILSEAWLSCNSLFAGESNKNSTTEDGIRNGWIKDPNAWEYRQFWDVTPRAFFLIVTNYVGLRKTGIAIDRFTGDQVWNQPVVGYRILPLKASNIKQEEQNGQKVWAVHLGMKLYWADDGVSPGVVSGGLNVDRDTRDTRSMEALPTATNGETIYTGRLLEFTLFFDDEVKVSADGLKVLAAGRIVGDGIWKMQENPEKYSATELDMGHPDFIWLPTNAILDTQNGYGNPYMLTAAVKAVSSANKKANSGEDEGGGNEENATGTSAVSYKIKFASHVFDSLRELSDVSVRRKLSRLFSRAGHRAAMRAEDVSIRGSVVTLVVNFPEGIEKSALETLFADAELEVTSLEKLP